VSALYACHRDDLSLGLARVTTMFNLSDIDTESRRALVFDVCLVRDSDIGTGGSTIGLGQCIVSILCTIRMILLLP
jgi:hypothetical protein